MRASGSATCTPPVPRTLTALRFFDANTPPKPPCPAPLPPSWTREAHGANFSAFGPEETTAGRWVERPPSRVLVRESQSPVGSDPSTLVQIFCCVAHVSSPHRLVASSRVTLPSTMLIQTRVSDLPRMAMPSQPAYFSWVEN